MLLSKSLLGPVLGLCLCIGLGPAPVAALEKVDFVVKGGDGAIEAALRSASGLAAILGKEDQDGQTVHATALAEYGVLLAALYASGHYAPVIHVRLDGREAAGIAALDAPAEVRLVEVRVDPGPVFRFARAELGPLAPLAPQADLPKGFAKGEIAQSDLIIAAASAGVEGWRKAGHAKAEVAAQDLVADHRNHQLSVRIALDPGPKLRFGKLAFQGQDRMRLERLHAIAGLPEGEVFDPAELDRAAKRLRRSGVFKAVALDEADAIRSPDLLDITATLIEEKPRRYTFGAEMSSDRGLTLSGKWLHRNLWGGAERFTIGAEVVNIGEASGGADFAFAAKLERPATLTPDTAFAGELKALRLNEPLFRADLASLTAGLTHEVNERLKLKAEVAYEFGGFQIEDTYLAYRALALPLSVEWDGRDDRRNPTKGAFAKLEAKPFLGFDLTDSGTRIAFDTRLYRSFGTDSRFVLAARMQGGAVLGTSLAGTPRNYLFLSGGGGTVRGQPYQSLALPAEDEDGSSLGGTGFLGASLEGRLRVKGNFGLAAFVDAGTVFAPGQVEAKDNWHAGAGIGLRYATGIGPIRLDLAMPVGPRTGTGLQAYIGLGQAF